MRKDTQRISIYVFKEENKILFAFAYDDQRKGIARLWAKGMRRRREEGERVTVNKETGRRGQIDSKGNLMRELGERENMRPDIKFNR